MLSNRKTLKILFFISIILGFLFMGLADLYAKEDDDIVIKNGKDTGARAGQIFYCVGKN